MIGIIVNCITFMICLIWFVNKKSYESLVALLCSISTLFGQTADKIRKKIQKNRINQKIKSGNNSTNTQIGTINN